MNGWQWYESISKALEMSPCLFNWSPFQAIPGNPPPPPLSEVIDQNNNGSGGECNCHLTSTRLTIIPPQKNMTFVIQENWNQIGNELMEGVRLLHPFGRLGSRRRGAWEKKLALRDRVANRQKLVISATLCNSARDFAMQSTWGSQGAKEAIRN